MAGIRVEGNVSGNVAEVNAAGQIKVVPEADALGNPANVGGVKGYAENDDGSITGAVRLASGEVDFDYRARTVDDLVLDDETFTYTAQNTGKHNQPNGGSMAASFTAGQYTTNSGSITTATSGIGLATYRFFPITGATSVAVEVPASFSAQPVTNTFVEWGLGLAGAFSAAPTDGVFLRLSSGGLQGIASFNGAETSTGIFPLSGGTGTWVYTNNKRYKFITEICATEVRFWVDDGGGLALLGHLPLPTALSRVLAGASGQFFFKHRILGGAAGGVFQAQMGAYTISQYGAGNTSSMTVSGGRMYGSYQGLSGGTMGSLANYANSANPTAAVPTNTTAALGTGLGGQFWETATLALNTDGIICSYQNPVATANVQARTWAIYGVALSSYIQTVIVGGPFVSQYSLAYGHTAVSLATAESATTKAPRRLPLPPFLQAVTAAQAASTIVSQPGGSVFYFPEGPVYVNPGEFIALAVKHIGTVGTAGTIGHVFALIGGPE